MRTSRFNLDADHSLHDKAEQEIIKLIAKFAIEIHDWQKKYAIVGANGAISKEAVNQELNGLLCELSLREM